MLCAGTSIPPWTNWLRCYRPSSHSFSESPASYTHGSGPMNTQGSVCAFVTRVKSVIGIGVGAGAYVLTKLAVSITSCGDAC